MRLAVVAILACLGALGVPFNRPAAVTEHELRASDGTLQKTWTADSEGRVHGTQREYFADGALMQESEIDHGSWVKMVSYWPNGQMKYRRLAGSRSDTWESWDENGVAIPSFVGNSSTVPQ